MASLGRGGLQFILIIWLQGIWLPQHGYSFEQTPLWAGIYLLPMTVGFLISAPLSGILSDRGAARLLTTGGMLVTGLTFFAGLPLINGIGMGMFSSPNRAEMMNSLPEPRPRSGRRHDRHLPELGDGCCRSGSSSA